MWLENKKYREIRIALHSGACSDLDRVLHEIAEGEGFHAKAPTRCPICHKELKRQTLPYLEFFGTGCPDFHGWWLTPEISKKLRDFIGEQISHGVKKARQFKIVTALLIALLGIFFLSVFFPRMMQFSPKSPEVVYLLPMPAYSSAVASKEEWAYLSDIAVILENGITSRMSIESALKKNSSVDNRWKVFSRYRQRYEATIEKLKSMSVPEKMQDFHLHLSHAFENQMVFYALLTDPANSSKELDKKEHPAFKAMRQELAQAYVLLLKSYPALDSQAREALEERLFSIEEN